MIRFMRLHGVDLGDAALPQIPRTPEGQAMGAIPGWRVLLDPSYASAASEEIRNRALPNDVLQSSGPGELEIDSFPNGQPALRSVFNSANVYSFSSDGIAFNPTSWSMFSVFLPESGATGAFFISQGPTDPDLGVRIGLSSGGSMFYIYEYGDFGADLPSRINYFGDFANRSVPTLIMATFSTREGLRVYDNGEEVRSEPSDTRPLEAGYGPGQVMAFRNVRGRYGMTGVLDIDLGWPEHAGYRRAIERFLMGKYGIS